MMANEEKGQAATVRSLRLDMVSDILDTGIYYARTSFRLESADRRTRERTAAPQALSLDALARKTGVSRSMISVIERGESSPTAVVLEKLAAGLGVPLASLFDGPTSDAKTSCGPVARRKDQPQWQDPASGYRRRNVSPPGVPQPMQIVEVHFPPGSAWRSRPPCAIYAYISKCGCSKAPST